MAKRTVAWPQMLRDGGWRERKSKTYWPSFIRMKNRKVQQIYHQRALSVTGLSGWVLEVNGVFAGAGDLTEVLLVAER